MLRSGIPLGKLFGISIRLHISWFIIFALLTWGLSVEYFPQEHPDWTSAQYVILSIITSLLFFSSILLHELAHSIVAQRAGLPIDSIVLFILGGVSQMTDEPKDAGTEFRVAIAGPLTSIAISFFSFVIFLASYNRIEPIAAVTFLLAVINIGLALFNLIPGFPLDGGRVLRSIVWWQTHNVRRATKVASTIGKGVSFLFIVFGIVMVFSEYWINGVWMIIVGWFLHNAATGSYQQLALKIAIEGHKAEEVMHQGYIAMSPDITIEELVNNYILTTGRRCFPVIQDGHLIGLVTMRNVSSVPRDAWANTTVNTAMTPLGKFKVVKPDDDLFNVMQLMITEDIDQIPVVSDGLVVGVVIRDDIMNFVETRAKLGM